MGLAVLWLAAMEWLAAVGATSRDTTRKLVHIGTGPIYVGCWVFFPHSASARYWAALVPLLITLRFYLIGVGAISDPRTVSSMSRSGDRRELLKGPLCYGIIFILSTIIWFRHSNIAICALMVLCFGDGFADLLGRRFGRNYPLPWNRSKSVVGSAAFFLSALGGSLWMCRWFASLGFLHAPSPSSLAAVTLAATFVESLPIPDWDNLTVFLSVLFASNFVPL